MKRYLELFYHVLMLIGLWPVVRFFPRNPKKIIFGAWGGNQFSDNPKYFLKYILSLDRGYECYWFGNEFIREKVMSVKGVEFVLKDSLLAHWHVLTASWIVCNIGVDVDITSFPTYGKIKMLSFWHGTSYKGLKMLGYHAEKSRNLLKRFVQNFTNKNFSIAQPQYCYASISYDDMRFRLPYEVPWAFKPEMTIAAGTARIDYLIKYANDQREISRVRECISECFGLPRNRRWYLYMPTFRDGLSVNYSFVTTERFDEINQLLKEQNAILIEKQHPQVLRAHSEIGGRRGNVYVMGATMAESSLDTQELLLASNRLITDYSSCFCDFETMNRPVVHFVYDYEEYRKRERPGTHDIREVAAGPIAYNENELIEVMKCSDAELLNQKGSRADYLVSGEKGNACETFAKWVGLI